MTIRSYRFVQLLNCCRRTMVLALMVAIQVCFAQSASSEAYKFRLNGTAFKPRVISLNGTPDSPRPGDLVYVLDIGIRVTLGDERDCNLLVDIVDYNPGNVLYLEDKNGKHPIGVQVGFSYDDGERTFVNPLDSLTPAEIHGLWGVSLNAWSPEVAEQLEHANLERLAVTVSDYAGVGEEPNLSCPPLPKNLRYLIVPGRSRPGISDYSQLKDLKELRVLHFGSIAVDEFDVGLIADAKELRYLNLSHALLHEDLLGKFDKLTVLNLGRSDALTNIDWAIGMSALRVIDLSGTWVTDLSPLGELPLLREVYANKSLVEKLPGKSISTLRRLDVMSAGMTDDDIEDFSARNPNCLVRHRWNGALKQAVKRTDRVVVRTGGTCHRDSSREKELVVERDPENIRDLIDGIDVVENASGFHCMCCGSPTFEFYAGEELLASVGFHHGESLRWPNGWPGDAALSFHSRRSIVHWLADRGYAKPLAKFEEERAEELKRQLKTVLIVAPFWLAAIALILILARVGRRKLKESGTRPLPPNCPVCDSHLSPWSRGKQINCGKCGSILTQKTPPLAVVCYVAMLIPPMVTVLLGASSRWSIFLWLVCPLLLWIAMVILLGWKVFPHHVRYTLLEQATGNAGGDSAEQEADEDNGQ